MRKVIPFLVAAIVIGVMVWQQRTPEAVLMPTPEIAYPEIAGMTHQDQEICEAELQVLPKDTKILRRSYHGVDGHWYVATAVIGGRSKSSVHRPELCLPGQGFRMSDPHTILAGDTFWRKLKLERGNSSGGFAYTFMNGGGFKTSSHIVRIFTDVWDRSIYGRIDRWVMLTVSSSHADDEGLSRFLEKLEGVVQ